MDLKTAIKHKYDYIEDEDIYMLIKRAKSIFIDKVFPADLTIDYTTFKFNERNEMWLLDCVDELIQRTGIGSVTAYKENGMSWTFDNSGISNALLERLPSMAHAVKTPTDKTGG